jgi:uncharacterized cofD-like protein
VLPATLHDVRLVANIQLPGTKKEVRIQGESEIPLARGHIRRLWLEPDNPLAYPPSVQAILSADLIVVGPGSLFTSLLPDLLVPDIADALRVSRAIKFFVCNVATQPGETDGFTCDDHVRTIERHIGGGLFDLVICNNRCDGNLPAGVNWVRPTEALQDEYPLYCAPLASDEINHWHDPDKLAQAVIDLFNEQTGPMVREG